MDRLQALKVLSDIEFGHVGFLWISRTPAVRPHLPCFWRRFVIPLQRADAEALLGMAGEQRSGLVARLLVCLEHCEACRIRNPC